MTNEINYKNCTTAELKSRCSDFVFDIMRHYKRDDDFLDLVMAWAPLDIEINDEFGDEGEADSKTCESRFNMFILREFYAFIYANNVKCTKYLLNLNWLKDILQTSWIADMQFYDFDENKREYNLYFPTIELLDLLGSYGINIKESIKAKVKYSVDIPDNASYMSSSIQNKNAIKFKYDNYKESYEKYAHFDNSKTNTKYKAEHDKYEKYKSEKLTILELAKDENHPAYYNELIRKYKINADKNEDTMELTPKEKRDLQTIGRSWFVSRMYYEYIDKNHTKWNLTPTGYKLGTFNKIQNQHETLVKYLYSIMNSNEIRLDKNEIGLPGAKIKEMAKDLLEKIVSGEIKFNLSDEIKKKAKELLEKIKNAYIEKNTENDIGYTDKHLFDTDTDGISWELTPKEERDLQTIGKSWFVSRMYHDFIDRSHNNWELTPTGFKMGTFQNITRITQKKYLQNILKSNVTMLGKNKIGLSGTEVLKKTQELLDRLKEVSV